MIKKIIITGFLLTAIFSCAGKSHKSNENYERNSAESTKYKDVDNTAMNKRDADDKTLTPTDQMQGSKADVELTRKIREMLVDDDSLSMKAKNVKIITLNGITTLRGPVNTMTEKKTIEQLARTAGAKSIKNNLDVTTKTE